MRKNYFTKLVKMLSSGTKRKTNYQFFFSFQNYKLKYSLPFVLFVPIPFSLDQNDITIFLVVSLDVFKVF